MSWFKKFIGDKQFYKTLLVVVVPIIIQNAVSNFVGLLDNIMVGRVGTDPMNAVAIVNQLMFVFYLCAWGAVSGAGIFTVQYFGAGDKEGVRNTFRAKLVLLALVLVAGELVFWFAGPSLIGTFLHQTDDIGDAVATLHYAEEYLHIMMIGLVPFMITNAYANTLRDLGQTRVPMVASVIAVVVNLILNYILIFGNFGAPKLGVNGAAIATVVSRFIETGIVVIYVHVKNKKYDFIQGAYKTLLIPGNLMRQILVKGAPLAVNEAMWSLGITFLNQSYSMRGLAVVGAMNITSTIANLFNVVYLAIGESISIIIGKLLGAGEMEKAKDWDRKIISFSIMCCLVVGTALALCRNIFPNFYNTEDEVKALASTLILIVGCLMPVHSFMHASYFTLRTGGKTLVTFLFDSVFVWVISVPASIVLSRFTTIPIIPMYLIVNSLDLIKCVIGFILVKKGVWLQNIVKNIK